jgi:hypothetical protein
MRGRISLGIYGANHGTRIITLADRNPVTDHPDHLAAGRAELIMRLPEADGLPLPGRSRNAWRTGMVDQIKRTKSGAFTLIAFAAIEAAVAEAYECSKNGDPAQVVGQTKTAILT